MQTLLTWRIAGAERRIAGTNRGRSGVPPTLRRNWRNGDKAVETAEAMSHGPDSRV